MKRKPIYTMDVWVAVWPKGTSKEYNKEFDGVEDFMPCGVVPQESWKYFNKKENREILGEPLAVFANEEEARQWRGSCDWGWLNIRPAKLEVF